MELFIATIIVLVAYFVKGFSGFGPALIMVPFFALLFDPSTAIVTAALLDFIAGVMLIFQIWRKIDWRFVMPIAALMATGAIIGVHLLDTLPIDFTRRFMGLMIAVFAFFILFQKNSEPKPDKYEQLKYPVSFFSGLLGGLLSISGPPIVIYMKLRYAKTFFRSQLIAIFLIGSAWRFFLYQLTSIPIKFSFFQLLLLIPPLILGLLLGSKVHVNVSEKTFNRAIALIIVVAGIKLLF